MKDGTSFASLPPNLKTAPLQPGHSSTGVDVCLVLRQTPDPVAGPLVVLRNSSLATVVLGCLTDSRSRVVDWLELWLQKPAHLQGLNPVYREGVTNASLDREWAAMATDLEAGNPEFYLETAFAAKSLVPVRIDVSRGETVGIEHGVAGPWRLCDSDAELQRAGLPPYSSSCQRYLWAGASGQDTLFCCVGTGTDDAAGGPSTASVIPLSKLSGEGGAGVTLFLDAPRLIVTRLAPLSLENHLSLLGDVPWPGIGNAREAISLGGIYSHLGNSDYLQTGAPYLVGGKRGKSGDLLERLHLKLGLLRQIVAQVRDVVRRRQLPFLNLSAASFAVRVSGGREELPVFWTAQPTLVQPGDAFALPVPTTAVRRFQRRTSATPSIYQPEAANTAIRGTCAVRIVRVLPPVAEGIAIEATLISQERFAISPNSLAWIRLPLGVAHVDLYGYLDQGAALTKGEAVLRTLPQAMDVQVAKALQESEGLSFSQAPFEIMPGLSSPVDLYSLGVIATQILLTNPRLTLPFAMDGVLSLASNVAAAGEPTLAIGVQVAKAVALDGRWLEFVGPQNLLHVETTADEASALIPLELWWEVIGLIIRLFPGMGPASYCSDTGAAPDAAIEIVFDSPLRDLDALLVRTRATLLTDWAANVEIAGVLKTIAEGLD